MKFLHAMIRVKNIDKSLEFYCNLLGMKLSHTLELEDCRLHFLTDGVGDFLLELTENFETPEDGYVNGSGFGHFAFETESFAEFNKQMNEKGFEYLWEPFLLKEGGPKIAFLKDPDGNEIEIIEK
jgi:lactoylglutathione lyase